jgi:TPR repeat protein
MYHYAASYYGDADAQYHLGRMYLAGTGVPRDVVQAGRWFSSAAKKGHRGAQAMLGSLLFKGDDGIGRRAGEGLAWLTIAKDGAGAEEAWITETYSSALAQATIDERAMAHRYLELMMRNRRQ